LQLPPAPSHWRFRAWAIHPALLGRGDFSLQKKGRSKAALLQNMF
jgi:hypothetical protein